MDGDIQDLPPAQRIALNYAQGEARASFVALFALDHRLARIVAQAREPILAQMRLAGWRDMLKAPVAERPQGDAVLDAVSKAWGEGAEPLVDLVDSWERLLDDAPISRDALADYADGRSAGFVAVAGLLDLPRHGATVRDHARLWALTDLCLRTSDEEERATIGAMLEDREHPPPPLPASMRPLAVLSGLARRAIARGSPALLDGRGAVLAAMRLGFWGR